MYVRTVFQTYKRVWCRDGAAKERPDVGVMRVERHGSFDEKSLLLDQGYLAASVQELCCEFCCDLPITEYLKVAFRVS